MAEETLPPQRPDAPEALSLGQQSPTFLTAVEHVRKMRGGAQSHLMRGSDGGYYIVKFQNNPQSIRVLANEYFASRIGLLLGLPMPQVEAMHVSESLIADSPELRIVTAGYSALCRPGLQSASRYVADHQRSRVFDYMPNRLLPKVTNVADFARCLVFDKWTGNADARQAIFSRALSAGSYDVHFVDHGFCFNGGEWTFPDLALHGVYYRHSVYEHVTGWESFEPALSRAEQMSYDDLSSCTAQMPSEWYQEHHSALSNLIESLYVRRCRIKELISSLHQSERNPFVNW